MTEGEAKPKHSRRGDPGGGRSNDAAVAMHLVGHIVRHRDPAEAEKLYRASLSIGQEIGNHHHEGRVMHSLANLMAGEIPRKRNSIRQSLQILQQMDDRHGQAQVMHSLANRSAGEIPEEARIYRQSLQILQQMDDRHGQAQVCSLANLIGREIPRKQRISIGRAYRSYSRWMIGTVRRRSCVAWGYSLQTAPLRS